MVYLLRPTRGNRLVSVLHFYGFVLVLRHNIYPLVKASFLRKADTKNIAENTVSNLPISFILHQADDISTHQLEEAEALAESLFQPGGTYSVTTPGGDRFRVDPTLKTCFNVERDGADLVKLWT